jgi:hypothetical protein
MGLNSGQKKGEPSRARPLVTGANPRDQLRSARPARVPVVVSVLPEDEPIDELLPEELGVDEELVSLVLPLVPAPPVPPVADGELEPLEEPVPEAPMLELELGELLPDELVEGDAPMVDEDEDGEELLLPVVLLGEVELLLPVVGVLLLVPVPLPLVEPAPLLLPADVPALPPEVPPVWAAA